MTCPSTRSFPDTNIGVRHSFSEAMQDDPSDFNHSEQSPRKSDHAKTNNINKGNSLKEQQAGQLKSDQHWPDLNTSMDPFNSTTQHSLYCDEDVLRHESDFHRNLGRDVCDNLGPAKENSPFSSQETVRCRSDSKIPVGESNGLPHSDEHSDRESLRLKETHEQFRSRRKFQEYEARRNKNPDQQRFSSSGLKPRKFNSMSSLGDSSRMSTPLFQPREPTRGHTHPPHGSTQVPKYKRRNTSDDVDSGFVGSEASRSSRLNSDHGVQKLSISNQWDSSLQLDLVSEIDENEVSSSPEQISTAYEDGRRSPSKALSSRQMDEHSKFINSSPLSSPENSLGTSAGGFGYKTSHTRLPSNGNLLPVHDTHDPEISHGSETAPVECRPRSRRGSSIDGTSTLIDTPMNRPKIRRKYNGPRDVSPEVTADISNSGSRVRSHDKRNEHKNERCVQYI